MKVGTRRSSAMGLWRAASRIVKAARPGFWPTQLWFFLLPLGRRDMFGTPAFWLGAAYVCFPLGLLLYGWNDIEDKETDRLNPRKDSWLFGACLDDVELRRLPLVIAALQVPFAAAFFYLIGVRALLWFAASVAVNALYNWRRWGTKNFPFVDLANQAGYLLIFVLSSWLCGVPQLSVPAMAFSALFAMQSHLFGQVMDIEEDRAAGRHTTAGLLGARLSKGLVVLFLVVEAAVAKTYFSNILIAGFLIAAGCFFALDALVGFRARAYPTWFSKMFFLGWNGVVVSSAYFVWRDGPFLVDVVRY